jgi:hypothetical protein
MAENTQESSSKLTDSQIVAVKDKVSEELKNVWSLVKGVLTFLGVANIGVLIALLFYVFKTTPDIIQTQVTSKVETEIQQSVTPDIVKKAVGELAVAQSDLKRAQDDLGILNTRIGTIKEAGVLENAANLINSLKGSTNVGELILRLDNLESRIAPLEPGKWNDLNAPADWKAFNTETPQCRKNGDWIEFRGTYDFTSKPFPYAYGLVINDFLPSDCRPKNTWPTAMINCWYTDTPENIYGFPGVCGVNFYNGDMTITSPLGQQLILQMSFEGLRIRSQIQ